MSDSEEESAGSAAANSSEDEEERKSSTSGNKKRKKEDSDNDDSDDNDDDDDDDDESPTKAKKKKSKVNVSSFLAEEAEISGSEDPSDDEDEEEEDDGDNRDYVRDGFVVDEDEESDEDDRRRRRKKKKKKKKKKKRRDDDDDDDDGGLEDTDDEDEVVDSEEEEEDDRGRIKKKKRLKKRRDLDLLDDDDLMLIREAKGDTTEDADRAAAAQRELDRREKMRKRQTVKARDGEELRNELFHDDSDDDGGERARAEAVRRRKKKAAAAKAAALAARNDDLFDEDALDDFIEDDVSGPGRKGGRKRRMYDEAEEADDDEDDGGTSARGVSEAQWNEASEIFGMEYLDMMDGGGGRGTGGDDDDEDLDDDERRRRKRERYRERGVGVDLGSDVDTEEEEEEEDSDDLFPSGDEDDDEAGRERKEAARARRAKRAKERAQRKKERQQKRLERKRTLLRRAYEPIVLVEHFCTPEDDDIRALDVPERFQLLRGFDFKKMRGAGGEEGGDGEETEEEKALMEEETMWIMARIPAIAAEFFSPAPSAKSKGEDGGDGQQDMDADDGGDAGGLKKHQRAVLNSIKYALDYIRREKLEVEFIRHYRADYVTSRAVRDNLYRVMDQHVEFTKMNDQRRKADGFLGKYADSGIVKMETSAAENGENGGDPGGGSGMYSRDDLVDARSRLEDALQGEIGAREAMQMFEKENQGWEKDVVKEEEDVDEDLFGNDDEDDDEAKMKKAKKEEGTTLKMKLQTCTERVQLYGERVAQIENFLSTNAEAMDKSDSANNNNIDYAAVKKICSSKLWDEREYRRYLSTLTHDRDIQDVLDYLQLIQEGNDAIRSKSKLASAAAENGSGGGGGMDGNELKRRSKRFDRDYYRTCVSEGLRSVAYQFTLSPLRAGVKLEDNLTKRDGFNYKRRLAGDVDGEVNHDNDNYAGISDPAPWMAPHVEHDPDTFASDLVSSGELVVLTQQQNRRDDNNGNRGSALSDPLGGCRYVSAMELAHEPRVRKHLRQLYRRLAVLTTKPTKKGISMIDAFHEHYGLHLIRDKPVRDHFADDRRHSSTEYAELSADERKEMDDEVNRREKESCLQYLRVMKAEKGGFITVRVHLPSASRSSSSSGSRYNNGNDNNDYDEDWYKPDRTKGGEKVKDDPPDLSPFMEVLEPVYLPTNNLDLEDDGSGNDGAAAGWKEERRAVLQHALLQILLPQFESETRRDLVNSAVQYGVSETADQLRSMALEGPYRPSKFMGENRFVVPTGDLPIVGVCVAPPGDSRREASYLAFVSPRGECTNSLPLPGGTSLASDNELREKVVDFLMATRPAAVLVGTGGGLASRLVARKLGDLVGKATDRWNSRHIQKDDEEDDEFESRMRDFRSKYASIANDDDDDDEESSWKCNVDLMDDNVAQLFGRSIRGTKEFSEFAVNLKIAIATARQAQNPLAELCYAWAVASDAGKFGAEMLYLNVHPMQQLLPKNMVLRAYERVLCGAVAEVGVDINAACAHEHIHGMLPFVPGLGARKAASLKQNVIRIGGVVTSRRNLLQKRLLGPVVYNNAVGFLRICDKDALVGRHLHPLDDTRLHPDVYHRNQWAVKIAIDALEASAAPGGEEDEYAISALRNVMSNSQEQVEQLFLETKRQWEKLYGPTFNIAGWDPRNVVADHWQDKVEELDLETFADMIEESGLGKWLSHLIRIKWEFRLPFEDPRKPMEPLSGDKLFRLLTGESDLTLYPGREITGRIIKNTNYGSRLKLEGDIPGFIPLRNLSDDHVHNAEDIVSEGSVVTAIVTQVKKEHMCVDMSLKMADFRKPSSAWERPKSLPSLDLHFDKKAALRIDEVKAREREEHLATLKKLQERKRDASTQQQGGQRNRRVTRRACAHPAFRNAKHDEVDRELRNAGEAMMGEALFRPSSQKCDALAIHWVVRPGCIKLIEVLEEDKNTDASIGNILKIKDEIYESLDEILGRFIAPMNDRVEEAMQHRKFMNFSEEDVDNKLRRMKKENPNGVFYLLCWSQRHPGYLSLRFILHSTVRDHPIGIKPDGFQWGPKQYQQLDLVLNDFKKNPRGPGGSGGAGGGGSGRGASSGSRSSLSGRGPPQSTSSSRGGGGGPPPPSAEANKPSRWGARTGGSSGGSRGSGSGGWGSGGGAPAPQPAPAAQVGDGRGGGGSGGSWGSARGNAPPPTSVSDAASVTSTTTAGSSWTGGGGGGRQQQPPPSAVFQQAPPTGMPPTHSFGAGGGAGGGRPPPPPPGNHHLPPPPGPPPPPGNFDEGRGAGAGAGVGAGLSRPPLPPGPPPSGGGYPQRGQVRR